MFHWGTSLILTMCYIQLRGSRSEYWKDLGVIRRRWVTNEEMIYCNHCAIFGHTANVLTNNDDIYKVCFLRSYHECINFL